LDARERNGEVSGECPWCHHHRTSFYVKVGVGVFKCHYCHESGWAIALIQKVARCTINEAIDRIMAQRSSIYEDDEYTVVEQEAEDAAIELPDVIELPEGFHLLADSHGETARRYWEYALTRMTGAQIREYQVGFVATGFYRKRIIVPVYYLGQLVNWVARSISDTEPKKVLTPPKNEQYSYLFNLEKVWGHERAVITEGVFDCLAMEDIAVASFGKKVTDTQVNALLNAGVRELVLCWDADAKQEIWDDYWRLRVQFNSITVVELPEGEDPASLGRERMVQFLKEAHPPRVFNKQTGCEMQVVERVRL
jgi:DNA primase